MTLTSAFTMKKNFTQIAKAGLLALATTLATATGLQAQITVRTTSIFTVGDSVVLHRDAYTGAIGDSGISQTWAFPTLTASVGNREVTYAKAPSATPFGPVGGSNLALFTLPDSVYSMMTRSTSGSNQGIYLKALVFDASGFSAGIPGAPSGNVALVLTNAQPLIKTPWTFGNTYTGSTFTSRLAIPFDTSVTVGGTTINIDSIGIRMNVNVNQRVNGWGTIAVGTAAPVGAIRDVNEFSLTPQLQVSTYTTLFGRKIPLGWQTFPAPIPLPSTKTVSVRYWTAQSKLPYVEFNLDTNGNATDVTFQPTVPTSLADGSSRGLVQIAPNPASGEVFITIPDGLRVAELKLFSATGQVVRHVTSLEAGRQRLSLDGLAAGAYNLLLTADGGYTQQQRLIVR